VKKRNGEGGKERGRKGEVKWRNEGMRGGVRKHQPNGQDELDGRGGCVPGLGWYGMGGKRGRESQRRARTHTQAPGAWQPSARHLQVLHDEVQANPRYSVE
jgi:hypothetical protein